DVVDVHLEGAFDTAGGGAGDVGEARALQDKALEGLARVAAAEGLLLGLAVGGVRDVGIDPHGVSFVAIGERYGELKEGVDLVARRRERLSSPALAPGAGPAGRVP